MNLYSDYQKKIFEKLKYLEKKKLIKLPSTMNNLTVELPPKNQIADISCNAAMILAKANSNPPHILAEILKKYFLENFKEFRNIEIAGPGFLNISFHISFWYLYINKTINLSHKFGSVKQKTA